MNSSPRPSALTVFVTGVINHELARHRGSEVECAYGIFYDSTRYSAYSTFNNVVPAYGDNVSSALAVKRAISYLLERAPRYHSLIIESDNCMAVSAINDRIISRARDPAATLEMEKKVDDAGKDASVGIIVNLIELRTNRGDCFVDIVNSMDDPTAKEGLQRAREWTCLQGIPEASELMNEHALQDL